MLWLRSLYQATDESVVRNITGEQPRLIYPFNLFSAVTLHYFAPSQSRCIRRIGHEGSS
jgi:hypothetical protein